jgi:hypothetical protein
MCRGGPDELAMPLLGHLRLASLDGDFRSGVGFLHRERPMNVRTLGVLVVSVGVVALSACSEPCISPVVPAHPDPCDGGECFGGTYCAVDAGVSGCVPCKPLGAQCTRDAECTADASCDAGVCAQRPATCPTALEIRPPRGTFDAPRGRLSIRSAQLRVRWFATRVRPRDRSTRARASADVAGSWGRNLEIGGRRGHEAPSEGRDAAGAEDLPGRALRGHATL